MSRNSESSHERGRPRSERARLAILQAAGELMSEGGTSAASVEAIAARAGVSKATIYKWWPSRAAVALDGFMASVRESIAFPEDLPTRDALVYQLKALIALFRDTSAGPIMRSLASQIESDPDIAKALRERWVAPRRAVTSDVLRRGIERGDVRADIDFEIVLDQLYAPIYYRLLFQHEALVDNMADVLVDQLLGNISP